MFVCLKIENAQVSVYIGAAVLLMGHLFFG